MISLLREILSAQQEGNKLQKQLLEEFKGNKSTTKRKVSSSSSSSSPEPAKKKTKKSEVTPSEDELCIIYEGSTTSKIVIPKELLKGPTLKAAVSDNFSKESTFSLPSEDLKLSNISKSMKQLKKFFYSEQLDKCNDSLRKDLTSLADFLNLPELKLELLKLSIAEFPSPNSKKIHLLSKVSEICKPLYHILLDLEIEDIIPVLKSFHNFMSLENIKSHNFFEACTILYKDSSSGQEVKKMVSLIYNDGTFEAMIFYLLEMCLENKNEFVIDEEKKKFLKDNIKDEMLKKRLKD